MYRYYIVNRNGAGQMSFPDAYPHSEPVSYGDNGVGFDRISGTVYGYVEYAEELPEREVMSYGLHPGPIPTYYPINEALARQSHNMMSYRDYREGSKTAEYRRSVDDVSFTAAWKKRRVDPMYHEKIDRLLDSYARRLAENMNADSSIGTRCPSVLITGGSNFPVRKKEKQVAAWERNNREWQEIQGIIGKIKSVGTGGISGDDPNALAKLKAKLEEREKHQALMKAANAAIRLKDTEEGDRRLCELGYTPDEIKQLREPDYCGRIGYPAFELSNNSAVIRQTKKRIEELEKRQTGPALEGWEFDGGRVEMNTAENRIQIFFDEKPDADLRTMLKGEGFRWAPSQGAWQRQLTDNAIRAAKRIKAIAPVE